MAIEQPTAAQWLEIEQQLKTLYCPVYLDCDGYAVRLMLDRVETMKLGIGVYVNGWFKGSWLLPSPDGAISEEARRFFPKRSKPLFRARDRRSFERNVGKRRAEELGMYKRYSYRGTHWTSFAALRRHLAKHNDRMRWITEEEAQARHEST